MPEKYGGIGNRDIFFAAVLGAPEDNGRSDNPEGGDCSAAGTLDASRTVSLQVIENFRRGPGTFRPAVVVPVDAVGNGRRGRYSLQCLASCPADGSVR